MLTLSKQLKKLCNERDITVSQLSRATQIPLATLNHLVNGRPPRKLEHIKILCNYFSCSSDFLLFGVDTVQENKNPEMPALMPFGRYDVYLKKIDS